MPADYAEVLKDLDANIASLEAEIATLKAGRPTIVLLRNRYSPTSSATTEPVKADGPYSHMGPTQAIPLVLERQSFPMPTQAIADKLRAGGVRSRGQDFSSNVAATLSRLRDNGFVEKIGEGWKLKPRGTSPNAKELDATILRGLDQPNAFEQLSSQ